MCNIIPFGEAMMGFANAVRGLDVDTVTNAATAGKALSLIHIYHYIFNVYF